MDLRQAPSVEIDGEAIRKIREEKRLTQLYVSKVVGVTTDTVSRWENNRYPTIRRDNALLLAEALEVEVSHILKQVSTIDEDPTESVVGQIWSRWLLPIFVVAVLLLGFIIYKAQEDGYRPPVMQAERLLPPYAAPGSRVLVQVKLSAEKPLKGMILREKYPRGWKLVEANPPASSLDNIEGVARWIFRKPETQTTVSYKLEVSKEAVPNSVVNLSGGLIANPDGQQFDIPVLSNQAMHVMFLHWADSNGNHKIDDLEILEVSELLEETGQLHLDWDLLEKLWDADGYRWDVKGGQYVPVRLPHVPEAESL